MTRYMLHYYKQDDGWVEFETKGEMEEEFEADEEEPDYNPELDAASYT